MGDVKANRLKGAGLQQGPRVFGRLQGFGVRTLDPKPEPVRV